MNELVDGPVTVHVGDALSVLRQLPSESVHCVVTSPPYWGLRDYGTAEWEGGEASCDHRLEKPIAAKYFYDTGGNKGLASWTTRDVSVKGGQICPKCGAHRVDSQLGLDSTPELYVEHLVEVFREVRRVLHRSGTVWCNLGDSYATNPKGNPGALSDGLTNQGRNTALANGHRTSSTIVGGLKPKDLVGIPWRVAFALRADGWWLRSDIVWSKPNPMPESVTDRPTKAHEYLFLLTKSERYSTVPAKNTTTGWQPTCLHDAPPAPATVLDPFAGSGTTLAVARRLGRRAVGIELQADYLPLIAKRIAAGALPLLELLQVEEMTTP